jgi:hypothetical protein
LLGYTLALRVFLGVPLAAGPTIYAAAIIVGLYVSDFLGALKIASQLVHLGGLLALAASVAMILRSPLPEFRVNARYFARGIAFLFCALLAVSFLYLMNERARFARWDEFSHWGTVIRAVYEAGTFHFHPNPLYFQDYPPGVSLFAYHLLVLTGYSEGLTFFACAVFLLCLSFGALGVALRLGVIPFLVACILLHVVVTEFGPGWSSVLIDHLLGAGFAACVVTYFITRQASKGLFAVPIVLGALVLIKNAGSTLALLAATIGMVDLLIIRYSASGGIGKMRLSVRDFAWIGAMFAAPLLVNWSWHAHVASQHLTLSWSVYSPFSVVRNVIACCSTSREIEVGSKFFAEFFNVSPSAQSPSSLFAFFWDALSRISLVSLFGSDQRSPVAIASALLLAGGIMAGIAPGRLCRLRVAALTLLIFLGLLGYLGSLLLAYLYAFSDFEGRILMSFKRYLDVYLLAWFLISIAIFAMLVSVLPRSRKALAWWAIAISGALTIKLAHISVPGGVRHPATTFESVRSLAAPPESYREEVSSFTDRIKSHMPADAKIYIMWQGSNGLHLFIVKYELLPRFTNVNCWSLGDAPDVGYRPCRWSAAELSTRLAPFDYVAVGKGLGELRQQYREMFSGGPDDADRGLFRIRKLGDRVSLEYVET